MEIRQIRYFVAVAEEENFSAASRRLHVSQPPITRQIQQLEAEMGVQLFDRHQKGVSLTPAGEAFLDEARQILTRLQVATERSRAAALGEIGSIEVGYFGSPIYSVIPDIVRKFRESHHNISVSLNPVNKRDQIEFIKDGSLHMGFGRYYPHVEGIEVETVCYEQVMLAISASHSLAGKKTVSLSQLREERMIVFPKANRPSFADEVIRILRNSGFEPHVEHEAADLSTALALTASGLGICPVPDSIQQLAWPNIRFARMRGIKAQSPVNCIYATNSRSPILQLFLETVRRHKR